MAGKFYAVKKGKKPGIYKSWDECKAQVDGYSGAVYKSFKILSEAEDFINDQKQVVCDVAEADTMTVYVDGSYDNTTQTIKLNK